MPAQKKHAGQDAPRAAKVASVVRSSCAGASEEMEKWQAMREHACKVLESLLSFVEMCDGDMDDDSPSEVELCLGALQVRGAGEDAAGAGSCQSLSRSTGLMAPPSRSVHGCMVLIDGWVPKAQVSAADSIGNLLTAVKPPLDGMLSVCDALSAHYNTAMDAYQSVWADPQLHVVSEVTGAPIADYLSALKRADVAFRVQYQLNRASCTFTPELTRALPTLGKVAQEALDIVASEKCIDLDSLFLLQAASS
ncbi:hypothetical protein DIPPA_06391 [Diplonema papillatum]|nr:hypothetical protein DIPPA_06391 [Diplonema papillatum]|eukprot:gene16729-25684_t